jgi:hypothetical protein
VDLYLESCTKAPGEIVLDLDATDIPLYGHQPEALLSPGSPRTGLRPWGGAATTTATAICRGIYSAAINAVRAAAAGRPRCRGGRVEEVARIVRQVRQRWPEVRFDLRADSGFCRAELMAWCEKRGVDYLFGLARNKCLARLVGAQMQQARVLHQSTGKAARVFSGTF